MAKHTHSHRHPSRACRVTEVIAENWLVVLVSHTFATLILLLVAHYLHVPPASVGIP